MARTATLMFHEMGREQEFDRLGGGGLVPLAMCVYRQWNSHENRPWPRTARWSYFFAIREQIRRQCLALARVVMDRRDGAIGEDAVTYRGVSADDSGFGAAGAMVPR